MLGGLAGIHRTYNTYVFTYICRYKCIPNQGCCMYVHRPFLIILYSLDVELLFLHRKDGSYCDYHVHGAYRKMQGRRGEFQSGWVMSTSTCQRRRNLFGLGGGEDQSSIKLIAIIGILSFHRQVQTSRSTRGEWRCIWKMTL